MPLIVQIHQQQFEILKEYREGDILTSGEAAALNKLLVEKVRKRIAPMVATAVRNFKVLSSTQHDEIQRSINISANEYEFKSHSRHRPEVPLDNAAREVALQQAELWGQQMGFSPESEEVRKKYAELISDASVRDQARELVRSRQGLAEEFLEGLTWE